MLILHLFTLYVHTSYWYTLMDTSMSIRACILCGMAQVIHVSVPQAHRGALSSDHPEELRTTFSSPSSKQSPSALWPVAITLSYRLADRKASTAAGS